MPVYKNRETEDAFDICGGHGKLTRDRLIEGDRLGGTLTMCNINTVEPGGLLGYHCHETDNELYFIVEGQARYVEDGVEYDLVPGDSAFCEMGSSHSIENTGDGPMRFVAVIQQP